MLIDRYIELFKNCVDEINKYDISDDDSQMIRELIEFMMYNDDSNENIRYVQNTLNNILNHYQK